MVLKLDKAVASTGAGDPVFYDLDLCHRAQGCENALQASAGTRSTLMSRWEAGGRRRGEGRRPESADAPQRTDVRAGGSTPAGPEATW